MFGGALQVRSSSCVQFAVQVGDALAMGMCHFYFFFLPKGEKSASCAIGKWQEPVLCSLTEHRHSGAALVPEHHLPSWGILGRILVKMAFVMFLLIN